MAETQVNIQLEMDKDDASALEEVEEEVTQPKTTGRLKSAIGKTDESGRKIKGRGFEQDADMETEERYSSGKAAEFDQVDDNSKAGPQRSIEGWIIFVSGVHEEASEDDIHDKFSEFGEVKNLHLPLDRRTGFVKGYALVEYETKEEAEEAIKNLQGSEFMDNTIVVDWAFSRGSSKLGNKRSTGGRGVKKYSRHQDS